MADYAGFRLTVIRDTGEVIRGVSVRCLNSAGTDVTAQLLGTGTPVTNGSGIIQRYFSTGPLPKGVYTFQLRKAGWIYREFTTIANPDFTGFGEYRISMLRLFFASEEYKPILPYPYVSAIYTIPFEVETPAGNSEASSLLTSVMQSTGAVSEIETIIPPTGNVFVDVHNRIRLRPIPLAVDEFTRAQPDDYFSDVVLVKLKTLSEDGELVITTTEEPTDEQTGYPIYVANMVPDLFPSGFPSAMPNDLSPYVANEESPAKWITLMSEPICFVGYYCDVMVWVPESPTDYTLTEIFYNSQSVEVARNTYTLIGSQKVQRVYIDNNPSDSSIRFVTLQVSSNVGPVTQVLKVNYQYGSQIF